ncbi:helix-turn-helix domain-containing protein [Sediminimonas qiaohouensis]|uniref:helix-turn-helix domain-containing protein n=1 Tax=Sediminimonas qiaohouensis TaxID=552061 RepID=UPI000403B4DA|nr:helix-turn-helix transcriptional regulator [Sediminimonas qiaohouensis]
MSHPVDVHVGKKLKTVRILRGMTQTNVADRVDISFQQIQKYELGRNRISASKLFELAGFLDVPPDYFFDGLESGTSDNLPEIDDEAAKVAAMLTRIKDGKLRGHIRSFISEIAASQNKR